MKGNKKCPFCNGSGFARIPRGVRTCYEEPSLTLKEANKMVGG